MTDFARERARMVERQIAGRGLRDVRLLAAFRTVPREVFVPADLAASAYEDGPLPIGEGQTISQPYIVARMVAAAGVAPSHRVLEVGAGCGYAAAILAQIAAEVYAIERHAALGEGARGRLAGLGYRTVSLRIGDGTQGWPEAARFDAILVSAAGIAVPDALRAQLAIGGRLVMPVGPPHGGQTLVRLTRRSAEHWDGDALDPVSFVPLVQGSVQDARRASPEDPPRDSHEVGRA